jgi:Eukaryotic aspartyl protease
MNGYEWEIGYGDESGAAGIVYKDVVSLGCVTANNQSVESATNVSSKFTGFALSSGTLGMGFSIQNMVRPEQQATFFGNIHESLESPVFTADLKHQAPGTYEFGVIDSKKHIGNITYTPVAPSPGGYWNFTGSGYAIGSADFVPLNIIAIADTGASLLLLPQQIVTDYYSQVRGATFSESLASYIFPCNATLPDFTFGVESHRAVVPGHYMNYSPADNSTGMCQGGIQEGPDGGNSFSVCGDIFLKSQFVVFDGGNTRIGFANKSL